MALLGPQTKMLEASMCLSLVSADKIDLIRWAESLGASGEGLGYVMAEPSTSRVRRTGRMHPTRFLCRGFDS
jgi:hypothetical protein